MDLTFEVEKCTNRQIENLTSKKAKKETKLEYA